jgi:hypothetical protein
LCVSPLDAFFLDDFSSSPHASFLPLKNLILPLIKNSIFLVQISGKIPFLETKVVFQDKKKFGLSKPNFLLKGKIENSRGEKETWGAGREIGF